MSKQQHPEKSFKDEVLKSLESNQNKERDIGSELNSQQEERRSIISRSDKESTEKDKGSRSHSKAFGHNNKIEPNNDDLTGRNQRRLQRSKEDKIVNKIVLIVVLVFLVIGGILGFSAYRYVTSSLQPLDPEDTEKVTIVIPSGSSNKAIGEILEDENIIKSGMIFNYYTKFNNLTGFQAGTYHFSPNMTLEAISEQLQNGEGSVTSDAKVTIPEGFDHGYFPTINFSILFGRIRSCFTSLTSSLKRFKLASLPS